MIRRPPRSTLDRSSAASDVYKRQAEDRQVDRAQGVGQREHTGEDREHHRVRGLGEEPVSYTHLRAHETVLDLVCRLLLEKKNNTTRKNQTTHPSTIEKKR